MDGKRFEATARRLERDLTADQCLALARRLGARARMNLAEVVVAEAERRAEGRRTCPRCGHHDVVRHGTDPATGRQRWRCRSGEDGGCGRTFNALTNTPLERLRRPEVLPALAATMDDHLSVRKAAERLGVAHTTVERARRRMLDAQVPQQARQVGGVIEADETFFLRSFKGHRGWKRGEPPENRPPRYRGEPAQRPGISCEQVPVLTAMDRAGGMVEAVLESRSGIGRALDGRIEPGSVVCSDGLPAYVTAAKRARSEHRRIDPPRRNWVRKAVGGKPRKPGRMGLGHVNAHHERLKTFVNRKCRGVSTHNLPAYLGWTRALRRPGFSTTDFVTDLLLPIHS